MKQLNLGIAEQKPQFDKHCQCCGRFVPKELWVRLDPKKPASEQEKPVCLICWADGLVR
jgi:hypothetical protein